MAEAETVKSGRPPVVETEAFKAAVAAAAEAAVKEKMEEILTLASMTGDKPAAAPQVSGNSADVLAEIFSKIGLDMAAIAGQGDRKKPLSAVEISRRAAAEKHMAHLILDAREPGAEKPSYKLIAKVYLNERLIEPYKIVDRKAMHNEITWTGMPSDAMVPINGVAQAIFDAWRESTGGPTKLVPTADTRPLYVTPAGLTVRGDPPKRQAVAAEPSFTDDLGFSNDDPNAPEVAVLGTVAKKARQNSLTGVGLGAVT